jgi:hypothetical protein
MPGIAPFTLQAALNNIGNAEIMIGNPFVAGGGGMASLGAVEGEIGVDIGYTPNDLKAPELTGGAVHQRTITIDHARVTVPVNMGDFAMWAKINPMGLASGGWSVPQSPLETSVLVIPRRARRRWRSRRWPRRSTAASPRRRARR